MSVASPSAHEESRPADPAPSDESGEPKAWESLALFEKARDGDAGAMGDLLTRYQERLRRVVRIRMKASLRARVESMDIVQNTLMVAIRKMPEFEPRSPGSMLHWLARIAEHKIRDEELRQVAGRRDRDREVPIDAGGEDGSSWGGSNSLPAQDTAPVDRLIRNELREILDEAVAELDGDQREVILLRDYINADWKFAAQELGRPSVGSVRELHRRAWLRVGRLVRPRLSAFSEAGSEMGSGEDSSAA